MSREQIAAEIKKECDKIRGDYFNAKSHMTDIKQIVTIEFQKKTGERNDWSSIILDFIGNEEEYRNYLVNKMIRCTIPLDYPGYPLGYKFHFNRLYDYAYPMCKRDLELYRRIMA